MGARVRSEGDASPRRPASPFGPAWGAALLLAFGCAGVDPYEVDVERGRVALSVGEAEDAADAYRSALALRPDDPVALHGLARSFIARGDAESALEVLVRLESSDREYLRRHALDDRHMALYRAADTRLRRGDATTALRLLRELELADPDYEGLDPLLTRALVTESGNLQVAGRPDEAELLLREAVGMGARGPDGALRLAEILIEAERVGFAISVLSDALLRHPEDRRLQRLMDRALVIRYPEGLPTQGRPGGSADE